MVKLGRIGLWGAGATIAMAVAACHPVEHRGHIHFVGPDSGFFQVNAKLACPETSGDLTRSAMAADGTSCSYTGPEDESVLLHLTPLMGAPPQAVLSKLESQLRGDAGLTTLATPSPPPPPAPPNAKAKDWDAGGDNQAADDNDRDDDDDSDHSGSDKNGAKGGHTNIDLPGVHISANGDKADVQLPFLSIHANGDNAQVQAGWFGRHATIEGDNGGAVIRVGRADQSGVDSMLIVTSDQAGPSGYRTVGYVAKGPPAGPLVIAAFKAKGERHGEHDLAGDGLKKLVALNVHQGLGWFSNSADPDAKP
jgi:hypothetical protein